MFNGTKELGAGKLGEKWEGPYMIAKEVHSGVYEVEKCKMGLPEMRPWNAYNLKSTINSPILDLEIEHRSGGKGTNEPIDP